MLPGGASKLKPSFIDTHCHLEMEAFNDDRDKVVERAVAAGITYIINAGSDRKANVDGLKLSDTYPQVYSAVGIHPHDAKTLDESLLKELKKWAKHPKVVAIGETGLDYHYLHSAKGVQIDAFRKQIALAKEVQLPIIVHSREARKDTIRILREEITDTTGVLHCFSGDREMAKDAMEMGFYISLAGPVTFKNARKLREVAEFVPDEFLLLETDAPYLSPVPMRGKRNEPAHLIHTAKAIADIRGISVNDLARITTVNARKLFKMDEAPEKGAIVYKIRNSLYLNITNKCTNKCGFCVRFRTSYVKGHNLRLERDPTALQIIKAIKDPRAYKEIVFCGIGEPMLRLDVVKKVAAWIKQQGGKVRINTNGHGNLIHKRNIVPELAGLVDSFSISLDAQDEKTYEKVCKPRLKGAFSAMIDFITEANKISDVQVTVVRIPHINISKCEALARKLGVSFSVRNLNEVG
jgi:TatD DNase family protein